MRAVEFSMRRLNDRMLVESQRPIQALLRDLLDPPYYPLVVTQGRIDGIVTASDLNKAQSALSPIPPWRGLRQR